MHVHTHLDKETSWRICLRDGATSHMQQSNPLQLCSGACGNKALQEKQLLHARRCWLIDISCIDGVRLSICIGRGSSKSAVNLAVSWQNPSANFSMIVCLLTKGGLINICG